MINEIPQEILQSVVDILGVQADSEISDQMMTLVTDSVDVERLSVWPPEAFAVIRISHNWNVTLPTTFSAKSSNGDWKQFELSIEPVFLESLKIAQTMYHNGPREMFGNLAMRSALLDTINKALNSGDSIEGATLGGPVLHGIPAEYYQRS